MKPADCTAGNGNEKTRENRLPVEKAFFLPEIAETLFRRTPRMEFYGLD